MEQLQVQLQSREQEEPPPMVRLESHGQARQLSRPLLAVQTVLREQLHQSRQLSMRLQQPQRQEEGEMLGGQPQMPSELLEEGALQQSMELEE